MSATSASPTAWSASSAAKTAERCRGRTLRPAKRLCRHELELKPRRRARQQAREEMPQARHAQGQLLVEEELARQVCAALHDRPALDAHVVARVRQQHGGLQWLAGSSR